MGVFTESERGINMDIIEQNWDNIKEALKKEYEISSISFDTWIKPLKYYETKEDVIYIIIPSDQGMSLNYISSKFSKCFQVIVTEMFEHNYTISFILEKDINSKENVKKDNQDINPFKNNINYENSHLNPKYKFDTFVVGSNNRLAHSASLAVAENPGTVYNPLYLYGGAGLGKTHLMHSIGHFILEQNPQMRVLYVTSEVFTNEVIESIRSGVSSMAKLREKYRNVDVLMVDDVQFIIGKESTQEEFFHTFNALYSSGKQIIISSDKPPKEMETLDERFRSRFEWGLIADITSPDYETRMAILRKNADYYNVHIDEDIIKYIATNIKSNIRELEGAFNKIIAAAKLNKVELTLPLAEEALKDVIYPNNPKEITPTLIINIVADHFGIKYDDIVSKKRNSEFVIPRQLVMYLCRELIDISYENIATILNKKDHTTIMHGCKKIESEIKNNVDFKNKVDIIIKKINPS